MTLQSSLLGIILFATSCSGQDQSKQQQLVQIDTAKLFDPKQEPVDYSSIPLFKNFVLLNQQPYALTIQGKHYKIESNNELFKRIQVDSAEVVKSKFYVIVDSSYSFNKLLTL